MKKVFIAATRQNDGKTLVSLGLLYAFQQRFKNVSYMKPVGQHYKLIKEEKIDKDAVLFREAFGIEDKYSTLSPIAVPRGFTEDYILNGNRDDLVAKITDAYEILSKDKDFLLIEGTGHAGVGSVFDLSNADVAKLVGAKVVLIALGGVGRCIDEIILNKALFDIMGVELLGVIINKVKRDKYDKVNNLVRKGLARHNIPVLGVIPYVNMLTKPSVKLLKNALKAEVLSGEEGLLNVVEKCVIGDMLPHDALDAFSVNTVLIVPANREGMIMTALCGNVLGADVIYCVSGIIFTSGIQPHKKIMNLVEHTKIPVLLVQDDSFNVATKINNMLVKLSSEDSEKIDKAKTLIENYVDIDGICEKL